MMLKYDLSKIGINAAGSIYHNLSYEALYTHETSPTLSGFEKAINTNLGAVNVDTGRFTGRSANDKYIVCDESTEHKIWWAGDENPGSGNKKLSRHHWDQLYAQCTDQLSGPDLYITDGYAGANSDTRMNVRVISEIAWQSHFCKNMFIRPTRDELTNFKPDWTIINACKTTCKNFEALGLNSEVFIAFNIKKKTTIIGGTWYGGEMKKGIFSMMNYFLPQKNIGAFHCSSNMGADGSTALFFGLSGTGKTTLSTDSNRALIGDDEHGWDDNGVFNFEGGCYAKCIDLSKDNEPDIYAAIKRNALLENLTVANDGSVNFSNTSKTQNTRVSYPIEHIDNIVKPKSAGPHPSKIIFLTCDAFGVLPPVSKLNHKQTMYQYLSGYTAKVAGTELGVTEPKATFSSCYGAAFLTLHPTAYAKILGDKMLEHNTQAYLVNTGWTGGPYGTGKRISLPQTRAIINAILDGSIEKEQCINHPIFNFQIPTKLTNVDTALLNPRDNWQNQHAYDALALKLSEMFINNFKSYINTPLGKEIANAGPNLRIQGEYVQH